MRRRIINAIRNLDSGWQRTMTRLDNHLGEDGNKAFMMIIVLLGALISIILSIVDNPDGFMDASWRSGFWQNLGTEMIGAVILFILIDIVGRTKK